MSHEISKGDGRQRWNETGYSHHDGRLSGFWERECNLRSVTVEYSKRFLHTQYYGTRELLRSGANQASHQST